MKKEYLYWCGKCGKYGKGSADQDAVDYTVTWIMCGVCHSRRKLGMEIVMDPVDPPEPIKGIINLLG